VIKSATRATLLATLLGASIALAQDPTPPSGPAQIFNRANEQHEKDNVAQAGHATQAAAQKADPAPVPAQGPAGPASAHDESDHAHAMLGPPTMPSAEPADDLPEGTIGIHVTGPDGQPYAEADIVLGVMASMGTRTEQRAKADSNGQHTFRGLATGSQQAYRVNVAYGGAKFSTTPFRLPEGKGYRARVPLQRTTQSDRLFIQLVGQTVVELRDDRLHVTQQARLANAGSEVYVLPKEGLVMELPEGYTAFQWQDQMTDQKGEEVVGKGFRLRGSFPPGTVALAWSFDLKREGSAAKLAVKLPWKTYTYRVIAEAPEGLKLRVSDFPEPERVKDEGRDLFFTQLQKEPGDPLLGSLTIKLDGIPGPGPGRWIASILAALLAAFGLSRAFTRGDDRGERKLFIEGRKQQLLSEARAVSDEHERGESGPEYFARRMDEIEIELAMLLRDEELLATRTGKPSAATPA